MKEKEIFALAVRILGLVFLYHGLSGIPESITQCALYVFGSKTTVVEFESVNAWCRLTIGFWLVRGAPSLMSIAYPHKKPDQDRA